MTGPWKAAQAGKFLWQISTSVTRPAYEHLETERFDWAVDDMSHQTKDGVLTTVSPVTPLCPLLPSHERPLTKLHR